MVLRAVLALVGAVLLPVQALAWGPEGHSIIAELAQRRLSPRMAAEVERLPGPGQSLASVASWADDVRDVRPEIYNWHFVDLALAEDRYAAAKHCHASEKGDCIVAELERLQVALASPLPLLRLPRLQLRLTARRDVLQHCRSRACVGGGGR